MNRFPPRKILVPFDCSARARLAWRHARMLAKSFGCELEALYVAPYYLGPEVVIMDPLPPAEIRRLQSCVEEQAEGASAVRVAQGDVAQNILQAAREAGSDMIVMATSGVRGWRRLGRESITEAVARSSPIPVLCARGEPRLPRAVLAPLAFEDYSLPGLWLAGEAARAFGARLVALHVAPARGEEEPRRAARYYEEAAALGAALRVARGRPVAEIVEETRRHGLTVLVVHRRGLVREEVLGSTAERVLRSAQGSVLTAPAPILRPPAVPVARAERWARGLRRKGERRRGERRRSARAPAP
jgi:nucleotide-binding universal stress UspA family protein